MKKILRKIPFLISVYHFLYAFFGAMYYGFPSRKIKVIGVTGTNGKTTTVDFASRIFKKSGVRVASFSSVKFDINEKEEKNLYKMTMPGRAVLQKMLANAVKEGCDVVIMEVTSEGIKQHRHRFIDFEIACITNVSPEHIESHGGFENYKKSKGNLFQVTKKTHIINGDDNNAHYFLQFPAKEKIVYGINNHESSLRAEKIEYLPEGIRFFINDAVFYMKIRGKFNVYNALAAIAISNQSEVPLYFAQKALQEKFVVPGRMEEVASFPFRVIVDYAVTPDALEQTYEEIKESFSPRKLIAVFGACGGGRDKWKRSVLGRIAAEHCDKIILTNEDPYEEDPENILLNIKEGVLSTQFKKSNLYEIIDRKEAIKKALSLARPEDVVIITGKGSEPWMCVAGDKKIPWDDREIVKKELNI